MFIPDVFVKSFGLIGHPSYTKIEVFYKVNRIWSKNNLVVP